VAALALLAEAEIRNVQVMSASEGIVLQNWDAFVVGVGG
jgi:hypothetical protein